MENGERQLKAILFSDVKSFSAMMGEDEERTVRLVKEHREIVRAILAKHRGEEHGTAGDSFFVLFASAVEAVQCAVEIQESFHRLNATREPGEQIWIRIGIHLGDILVDRAENRVYGDGINIAARTEPLAEPGGICITRDVYQQVHRRLELQAVSIGRREMKNILDAPELYRLVVGQSEGRGARAKGRRPAGGTGRPPTWVLGIAAFLGLAVAGVAYLALHRTPPAAPADAPPAKRRTIVVLPFENVARNESLSWLGESLSQGVADRLRAIRKMKVQAPPATGLAAEPSTGLSGDALARELGRRAGARWVVSGAFTAAGQDLKVTARVLLVEDGAALKVVEREGKVDAVLALQRDLDTALVEGLLPGIEFRERDLGARASTANDSAYQAFSRANELFRRDGSATPQNLHLLRDLLEEALRHDPDYVAPHNLLASILLFMGGTASDIALLRESLAHADAVVRLSGPPDEAWSHAQRCRVRMALGMYTAAIEDCEKARMLDPDIYYEPGLYEAVEQFDHEERLLQDLVRREGDNYWPWLSLGGFYVRLGRLEEARAPLAEAVRIHDLSLAAGSDSPVTRAGWLEPVGAHATTGTLHLSAGDLQAASGAFRGELERLAKRPHGYKAYWTSISQAYLALAARLGGDADGQAEAGEALEKEFAAGGASALAQVAWNMAALRNPPRHRAALLEQALAYARRAVEADGRKNPFFLDLLAGAHEELGHRDDALAVNAEGKALLPECETFDRRARRLAAGGPR